jgi:branched-chain amino acid transport system ATP-binding protein
MTALLRMANVRAGYGESVVLHDLSLQVDEGEVVCLIGANGAGKTTTTRALTGLLRVWGGEVHFDGERIDGKPSYHRVEKGICLAPEGRQVFPYLSVMENLLLGSYCRRARRTRKQMMTQVFGLFPILAERSDQKAGLLSGGQQQMLAIGRALMGKPRLLVLDEPSLGLAPKVILDVYQAILQTAKQGISILFVEQNVQAALSIAQRGYVLSNGRIALAGSADELRGSQLVQEAFLPHARRPAAAARSTATDLHHAAH